jgi:hypothetical protein
MVIAAGVSCGSTVALLSVRLGDAVEGIVVSLGSPLKYIN